MVTAGASTKLLGRARWLACHAIQPRRQDTVDTLENKNPLCNAFAMGSAFALPNGAKALPYLCPRHESNMRPAV